MIARREKNGIVIFSKKSGEEETLIALFKKKQLYNARLQRYWGNVRTRDIASEIPENILQEYISRENLTEEEFKKLEDIVVENAVLW